MPIAKIVPLSSNLDLEPEERALVTSGHLCPPEMTLPRSFWTMPGPRVPMKQVLKALLADRAGE